MLIPMKVDYGVRVLVFLAQQPSESYASTTQISKARHVPEPFLLHICSDLQKSGLIQSRRGPYGGYRLALPAQEISITDVIKSLDFSLAPLDCVNDAEECKLSGSCTQRDMWRSAEHLLLRHLSAVSVDDLATEETFNNPLGRAVNIVNNDQI